MSMDSKKRMNTDDMEKAASQYNEIKYKYDAFISYRHTEPDQTIAREIHKMIETFKAPKEFEVDGKKPSFRVFRDREELAAKDLGSSIEDALRNSHYFIVICSKRTPLSKWCTKEAQLFKSLHGDDRIIPVLLEGEPSDSFPKPIIEFGDKEKDNELKHILAADLRANEVLEDDFKGYEYLENNDKEKLKKLTKESLDLLKIEKYRIMAAILGCTFGDLKQRDKERKNKLIMTLSSIVGAVFLVFGLFMANAYQKAEKARQVAVQSNASILMKESRDLINSGDSIKAVLVAREAMKDIEPNMENYNILKAEEQSIYNDSLYHSGASMLTTIPTKNKLTYFSISDDGKYIAYGLGNNQTAIASSSNGQVLKTFKDHTEQVKLVDFSPDGKLLSSSSFDNKTIIYDLETDEQKAVLELDGIPMMSKFSKDGSKFFQANTKNFGFTFQVYNTNDWSKYAELKIDEPLAYAEIKDDATEILIVLKDNVKEQLTRRNLKTGEIIQVYPRLKEKFGFTKEDEEYEKSYRWARYSNDGKSILVESIGNLVKYSLDDNSTVFNIKANLDLESFSILYESQKGDKIILKSGTNIEILNGKTGKSINNIYFEDIDIKSFAYDEKTNVIIVSGSNEVLGIWKDGIIVENKLHYGNGVPTELKFLPDGSKLIASSHENQVIKIVDINSRVQFKDIDAQLISVSNDSSKILFFDGENFLISDDINKQPKKIDFDYMGLLNYISEIFYYKISNDGRYIASLFTKFSDDGENREHYIRINDLVDKNFVDIKMNTLQLGFSFMPDSKSILVTDEIDGIRIFDIKTGKKIKEHKDIINYAYKLLISDDSKTLILNRTSGTSDIYNLETGELIDKIPGEALYIQGNGDEMQIKGIHNNSGYKWQKNKDMETFDLDEQCTLTPISFSDINLYNEKSETLLMIRNNENQRICYVVDFNTGRLKMSFRPSVTRYKINGYISSDGRIIAMDQYYYNYYSSNSFEKSQNFRSTAVYKMLNEEEVLKDIENLRSGRELTDEEKIQIGIKSKKSK